MATAIPLRRNIILQPVLDIGSLLDLGCHSRKNASYKMSRELITELTKYEIFFK